MNRFRSNPLSENPIGDPKLVLSYVEVSKMGGAFCNHRRARDVWGENTGAADRESFPHRFPGSKHCFQCSGPSERVPTSIELSNEFRFMNTENQLSNIQGSALRTRHSVLRRGVAMKQLSLILLVVAVVVVAQRAGKGG